MRFRSRQMDASKVEENVASGYPSSSPNLCHGNIEKGNNRKRPVDQKAAKATKERKLENSMVKDLMKEARNNWTISFSEANNASLKAARVDAKENAKTAQKEPEIKEEASELGALELLFTRSNEDSVTYRNALKKKRL